MNKPQAYLDRPLLRGSIHQASFFMSLGAGALLIAKSTETMTLVASSIYIFGLLCLFGTSASYHRFYWPPAQKALMKRLDHSAIYILIAGTFTPISLLALPQDQGETLLVIIWSAAILGILKSIFWVHAPKPLSAILYVIMGWLALPYLSELKKSLGLENLIYLIIGGFFYSIGALFFAARKPQLSKKFFSYHELFHLFTLVAAIFHFVVVYRLIH